MIKFISWALLRPLMNFHSRFTFKKLKHHSQETPVMRSVHPREPAKNYVVFFVCVFSERKLYCDCDSLPFATSEKAFTSIHFHVQLSGYRALVGACIAMLIISVGCPQLGRPNSAIPLSGLPLRFQSAPLMNLNISCGQGQRPYIREMMHSQWLCQEICAKSRISAHFYARF